MRPLSKSSTFFFFTLFLFIGITLLNLQVPRHPDYSKIKRSVFCEQNASNDRKYLFFPMVTIVADGGLGNQLFEVFSLLGMARTLNRTAVFNDDDYTLHSNLRFLRSKLPRVAQKVVSIPIEIPEATRHVASPACCHFDIPSILKCEQSKFLLVDGVYFQSFKYFSSIESEIRNLLKPSEEKTVELKRLVIGKDEPRFKTCVHIRRGDFVTDGIHAGTDQKFTLDAIKYLRTLHSGPVFLFSNDPDWVLTQIVDHLENSDDVRTMKTPKSEALNDLYFSQVHCDSVLITAPSSTFGWWMGYLSKNASNVFYRDIRQLHDAVKLQMVDEDFFPPQWKKLKIPQSA